MTQNQAELLVSPCGLVQRILEGERIPCLSLLMLSHRLLLAWGTTLSSEGATPFLECSEPSLPNPGTLSFTSQGTGPRLPPDYVAAVPYIFGNDSVRRGTSTAGDTYLLPLQSSLRVMVCPAYLGVA
jgi:hypothetical protein